MIIRNDFKEFDDKAREVDRELFYVNLYIHRAHESASPCNNCGHIYIPDTNDADFFAGELAHEGGHSVFDPITLFNYISALNEVCKALNINYLKAMRLGRVVTDIIVDYNISKNEKLRNYRLSALRKMFSRKFNPRDHMALLLWCYYNEIHGKISEKLEAYFDDSMKSAVNKIVEVLEREMDRVRRYVSIAKVLLEYEKSKKSGSSDEQNDGQGEGQDEGEMLSEPLVPNDVDEVEKTVKQILEQSKNVDDAKRMICILKELSKGLGRDLDLLEKLTTDNVELLRAFYQSKADKLRAFVSYPKIRSNECIKIGAKKWRPCDGVSEIDTKKTIVKFGLNVPLVTTRTARVLNKFISSKETNKPIDIVISIDTSGSVDEPRGLMCDACDYEVIMTYALIDEAKRRNQRVALTLWSSKVYYTTLPKTYDWREVDKLKTDILQRWSQGFTHIIYALRQAKKYCDKLFLVFTDGEVVHDELIDVDNVVFFLIAPSDFDYKKFVEVYGANRVVKIESIEDIPKVSLEWYRRNM